MDKRSAGFTLIELMIVVAIIAVLAGIAIPSYQSYIRQAHRSDAMAALTALAAAQEKYYLSNNTYADTLAKLNITGTERGYYTLAIPSADATAFTATATAPSSSVQYKDTDCRKFTITSTAAKTAIDSANGDTSSTCWH